jgi:hypothetical protein
VVLKRMMQFSRSGRGASNDMLLFHHIDSPFESMRNVSVFILRSYGF